MKKLLHIIATPRGAESRTLRVSGAFLDAFVHSHPGWTIDELNLSDENLPELTVKRLDGKYQLLSGKDLTGEYQASWKEILYHIERFLSADAYLISTPMWNLSIPHILKHYIDIILQPKYLFRYTASGPEGLVKGRKMVVVASRGGDYGTPQTRAFDHQEPYLRSIFGFAGITDIQFIVAQPMDMGEMMQSERISEAMAKAGEAGTKL